MSYMPKTVKCKMNFKNITDEEIMKSCINKSEVAAIRKFYEKLDGVILILSLWDYDNKEDYHLSDWADDTDNLMMEAMFIMESNFGVYSDYEEFKKDWEAKKYDPGASIVFPKNCVVELQVICEESNKLSEREKLELLNSMKIIDSSSSCGECEYILVENNEANRGLLHKLGITDEEIEKECYPEGDTLDISSIGERYANWFSGKEKKFFNK